LKDGTVIGVCKGKWTEGLYYVVEMVGLVVEVEVMRELLWFSLLRTEEELGLP